jgi:carbamoyltransferase
MIKWGLTGNSHDASIAVFVDNKLTFASHSERFSGIKNDAHLNKEMLEYALQWGVPREIIWYEKPFKKTLRQMYAGQGWLAKENNIKSYISSFGVPQLFMVPITYSNHHESHAAAGYFTSKFTEASIIVADSIGEWETLSIWNAKGSKLKKIYSQGYPHSLGLWYSAMTQRIGLKPNEDEYILMGMAAYGNQFRLHHDILTDFFKYDPDSYGNIFWDKPNIRLKQNLHRGCKDWRPDLKSKKDMFDIAAATQSVYEYFLKVISNWAHWKNNFQTKNLVMAGGCALNCHANRLLTSDWDNVHIFPNPGDAGSAVGAVLAKTKQHIDFENTYLGYNIDKPYPVKECVEELLLTGIVGVANGPAEFGPRALGNRSLLADPRRLDMKDRVNEIKQRQKFRPFAPVILEEFAKEYFEGHTGEWMQFTAKCNYAKNFPAIVHEDGTSRVQTVPKNNSGIRKLLEEWYRVTDCPMLLNTSLNIKGKPIVNNLTDAEKFANMYRVKVY